MDVNPIVLPSWLKTKGVFQQGIEFKIEGYAAPSATITLEVSKDPTDGRRVSKLDTEYGVILSLETTTSVKGRFSFSIPAYKASTDTYTFIFKCFSDSVKVSDVRCGDVWVFLGSDMLATPIKKANAPSAPMKRNVMGLMRFMTPARHGLEGDEVEIKREPKRYFEEASWIGVMDTMQLANVSSAAFAFAYNLADQIHYPVGVIDLSYQDSSILNWISKDAIEHQVALRDYLSGHGLYVDDEAYADLLRMDKDKVTIGRLKAELDDGKKSFDFDLSKQFELNSLEESKPTELDADGGFGSTSAQVRGASGNGGSAGLLFDDAEASISEGADGDKKLHVKVPSGTASNSRSLDFNLFVDMKKPKANKTDISYIKAKFRTSTLFASKLYPLRGLSIRGMCYSPNNEEKIFGRYDLLLMGLLESLSSVFEPKEVMDDSKMPSLLFCSMHPESVDFDNPYSVLEFNENLSAFTRKLIMPSGIVSCHDLLLPDKTKSFTLGTRLSVVALGLHFSPKMPTSCPECVGAERAGNKMILSFDNLADGLRLAENESILRGFAICGPDRVFRPANARILHGVRVMVWREDIPEPVSVSYGFLPFPHEATFKNLADLPVLPFRFDREPSFYTPDLSFASCDRLEFVGKKSRDMVFERLTTYKTIKGNGVIGIDSMNKTEGSASLHIRYDTENSLYGFEPDLSYATRLAPIDLPARTRMLIDVFNPELSKKTMRVVGFKNEVEIKQQLNWQTLEFEFDKDFVTKERREQLGTVGSDGTLDFYDGHIILDRLQIMIEDNARNGEIYIDNIRFK